MSAGSSTRVPPRRSRATGDTDPGGRPSRARRELVIEPGHRRHVLVWSLAVLTVIVLLALGAALSPLLDVETIVVTGVPPDRAAEVEQASGIEVGDSIVTFLPWSVAGRVEQLAWVAKATVTRSLPSTVQIAVVPRIPVGWTTAGSRVAVVGAEGQVLWRADAVPPGLPELFGLTDVGSPGESVSPRVLARAAAALGPDLRSRTAALTLEDGALTQQVAFGPQVRFGAPRAVAVKSRVVSAVLARLDGQPVTYIDVSVPAAPVTG